MGLRNLTNSMRSKFNRCHRAYKFCYVDMKRPAVTSEALSFGTAMHVMLEQYWSGKEITLDSDENDYTFWTLKALMDGYISKWQVSDSDKYETIAAEVGFTAPLMNPETGGISKTFQLAGKIDALAKEKASGKTLIVEHKTTSQDIGPGSAYWLKLPIDGQVSGYYVGAQSLGYEPTNCLYDVIRKPTIKPYKATPVDKRKYNKDGSLSKACREFDETPQEWYERLKADIAERPDYYYARLEIARSNNDLEEYLFDMWAVSREIADAERMGRFSRNPDSCNVFGSCEYFDVCSGCADIDDVTLFRTAEKANEEL